MTWTTAASIAVLAAFLSSLVEAVEALTLAFALLGIVALAALVAWAVPGMPLAAGGVLLFGCLGVLFGQRAH